MEDFAVGFVGLSAVSAYSAWAEHREGGDRRDIIFLIVAAVLWLLGATLFLS